MATRTRKSTREVSPFLFATLIVLVALFGLIRAKKVEAWGPEFGPIHQYGTIQHTWKDADNFYFTSQPYACAKETGWEHHSVYINDIWVCDGASSWTANATSNWVYLIPSEGHTCITDLTWVPNAKYDYVFASTTPPILPNCGYFEYYSGNATGTWTTAGPEEELYYPIISPTTPPDCAFSSTTIFSGTATGQVEIPSNATGSWFKLEMVFANARSVIYQTYVASTTFSPWLVPGNSISYSIPWSVATGTWDIWYVLRGMTCPYVPCSPLVYTHFCGGTGLGISIIPTAPEWVNPPTPLTQEECSGYNLLERLVCEIKNFFSGLFLPSASSTAELGQNLDLLKQRAPYNYIDTTKNFFSSIKEELGSTSVSVSIMGASSSVDFSILNETNINFAGSVQTFSSILRKFFTLILLLGFIAWATGYLRKMFK
jgi:hypothetical protein